jgi:hypothetical protein
VEDDVLAPRASDWAALQKKLWRGIDRHDIKLTRDECKILLQLVQQEQRKGRRGPTPDPELPLRAEAIAALRALYELDGMPPKAAVDEVMQRYGVARSQVFDACRQYPNSNAKVKGMDPTWGRMLIRLYESIWAPKRRHRRRRTRRIES